MRITEILSTSNYSIVLQINLGGLQKLLSQYFSYNGTILPGWRAGSGRVALSGARAQVVFIDGVHVLRHAPLRGLTRRREAAGCPRAESVRKPKLSYLLLIMTPLKTKNVFVCF